MNYVSTRKRDESVSAAQAIVQGLSKSGGLFVPERFAEFDIEAIVNMHQDDYDEVAAKIIGAYLTDFSEEEIKTITAAAYGDNFDSKYIVPLVSLNKTQSILELFHGPTLAFKDVALQILPRLMTASMKKVNRNQKQEKVLILVATSGDTGKAALEGFKDIENTAICVFYPQDGVSDVQKLQMTTQEGSNVGVCSIIGNFDDAQTGVKEIFSDKALQAKIKKLGYSLSSANSINWGRLVPQITYFFWSYIQCINQNNIDIGEEINFVVPTGNFGDILAGYYAKQMGLPIHKLICASNSNNVLTDFFNTGCYNKDREFFKTVSPSMDILISSNLERLLFEICDRDSDKVRELMDSLKNNNQYTIDEQAQAKLQQVFYADFATEQETLETIKRTFYSYEYLLDTHTAVAQCVYEKYVEQTKDKTYSIVLSTASPYKFSGDVLRAFDENQAQETDTEQLVKDLCELSKVKIPPAIAQLADKPIRFNEVCEKKAMPDYIIEFLTQLDKGQR